MSRHGKPDASRSVAIDALSVDRKLDEVFEKYKPEITGTIHYLYAGSENASKVAYEKLREKCRRYYENSKIGDPHAWVFRILYNLAYETVGNLKSKRRRNTGDSSESSATGTEMNEEELIQARKAILKSALLNLRFSERAIFLLRQNGGLSYDQIARITGFSEVDVKSQMKTAIGRLIEASDSFASDSQKKKSGIVDDSDSNGVEE